MGKTAATGLALAAIATGCVEGGDWSVATVATQETALTAHNGISLNGRTLNGRTLNGRTLNGRTLNGRTLNGRTLEGVGLQDVSLRLGELVALAEDGHEVRGAELAGAIFEGELDDGTLVTLGIDEVAAHPELEDAWSYRVWFEPVGTGERDWACGLGDTGVPVPAIALAGRWDYSEGTATGGDRIDEPGAITLACEGAVLAKCAGLGYAPWRTVTETGTRHRAHDVSLAAAHQACTRMLRADYCGDGFSHTHEGVAIDLWDAFGVQDPTRRDGGRFEAEWTAAGARCFAVTRLGDDEARDYVEASCPDSWDSWSRNDDCGERPSDFYARWGYDAALETRTLLLNETLAQP